jgi:hypothetical protein
MLLTAISTHFPRKRLSSPSRSSRASWTQVEAHDGTMARPKAPDSRVSSTSTLDFLVSRLLHVRALLKFLA